MTIEGFILIIFAGLLALIAFILLRKYRPYLFKDALFVFGIDISQKLIVIQLVLMYSGIAV